MSANLGNPTVATRLKKVSFHSHPKEGQCSRMFRLHIIVLISHASKVMVKTLQAASTVLESKNSRWFQIVVLEKTPESPLDSKEIKPVNPKGN